MLKIKAERGNGHPLLEKECASWDEAAHFMNEVMGDGERQAIADGDHDGYDMDDGKEYVSYILHHGLPSSLVFSVETETEE